MPIGYSWSKSKRSWVKKKTTREIDYEARDDGESWALLISLFRWYPDLMLDILEDDGADFSLAFVQRMNLRIFARYQKAFITGSRGLTKSFAGNLSKHCDGVLWPGEKMRYYGPALVQMAPIASKTYEQIKKNYPLLTAHYKVVSDCKDRFELESDYHSDFMIATMRGDNCHAVLAEEVGQEDLPPFDWDTFGTTVLPAVRLPHPVDKQPDPLHRDFKKQYITSASRQQNDAFKTRCGILQEMLEGGSAFAIDYPWQVALLFNIRRWDWAEDLRKTLTPEGWMREMESRYTGVSENPVIRDSTLTESKKLTVMEPRHCGDPNAIYIIGYDVSYEDGARNAKCALSVTKCTHQKSFIKQGKYLKQVVYVEDMKPTEASLQARYLKQKWSDYSMEGGKGTYIVIDGWQYGKSVVENLMKDLNDGYPPLCCYDHQFYKEIELAGALPIIYPIKETGGVSGEHDPTSTMLQYAELEFEHGNVWLLTTDVYQGVEAYKKAHLIKDSDDDGRLSIPYAKTKEMIGQIGNLKRTLSGFGWKEERISRHVNRDMWSCTKYGLRFAQILEYKLQKENAKQESSWAEQIAQFDGMTMNEACGFRPRIAEGFHGGRIRD